MDQNGGPPFLAHNSVERLPVVVGSSGGSKDRTQQLGELGRVEPGERVVGADDVTTTLGARPLPTGSEDDRGPGPGPQVGQFCLAVGDEGNYLFA